MCWELSNVLLNDPKKALKIWLESLNSLYKSRTFNCDLVYFWHPFRYRVNSAVEKGSLYVISSLYGEVSLYKEYFWQFSIKVHHIVKIWNFTIWSSHCTLLLSKVVVYLSLTKCFWYFSISNTSKLLRHILFKRILHKFPWLRIWISNWLLQQFETA